MEKILMLAELFVEYKLYPSKFFNKASIAHVFQEKYRNDSYSQDLKIVLSLQQYESEQRGADLPWWGNNFFNNKNSPKVMVISLDSNSEDAGSVVFHACLWPYMNKIEYVNFINSNNLIKYRGYDKSKELIQSLGSHPVYITDLLKVYRKGSWKDKDYDQTLSMDLLREEIRICDPELIVLLGIRAMKLFGFKENFSDVCGKRILKRENKSYIIAPFPSGRNRYYSNLAEPTKSLFQSALKNLKPSSYLKSL